MSLASLLDSDVVLTLIPFLGFVDAIRILAPLTKQSNKKLLENVIQHKKGVVNGRPVEESGRLFSNLIDGLRQTAYSLGVAVISKRGEMAMEQYQGDLHALRGSGLYNDVNQMNTAMYTHWNSTPSSPFGGVYQAFVSRLTHESAVKALDEDIQYWNSSRVYGEFILLFDRPDGAILVTEDCTKVYLVLGLAQSIGEVSNLGFRNGTFYKKPSYAPPKLHGPLIGITISATLLNWQNMIIYDGLMLPTAIATKERVKAACKAYVKAMDTNTLITTLPKKSGSLKVIPKPEIDQEEVRRLKRELFGELEAIKSKRLRKAAGPHDGLVFRRFGYSEEENPNHLVTVLGPGVNMASPMFYQCQALRPTVTEYVKFIREVVDKVGKPASIAVDEVSCLDLLSAVLSETGLHVAFYPPPSEEETTINDLTNPNNVKGCAVCRKYHQEDGTKLLRCGRCKNVVYCSKEHQKLHWKMHKLMCIAL